jgi:4-hydroxymandelate oxidase
VTVDTPVLGSRDRERRQGFAFPPDVQPMNLLAQVRDGTETYNRHGVQNQLINPAMTWQDIRWLRSFAKVPVLLKGILVAEDAKLAVEHGADESSCRTTVGGISTPCPRRSMRCPAWSTRFRAACRC